MKINKMRNRQSGFSLLEITMVAGIIILFSVAAIVGYRMASDSANMNKAVNSLNSITAGVRNMFATQGDYVGLTNAVMLTSNSLPEDLRGTGSGTIKSPWLNAGVTLSPANVGGTANDGFNIRFNNVPARACQNFVTQVFKSYTITVGSTPVTSVATASTACASGTTQNITFATR